MSINQTLIEYDQPGKIARIIYEELKQKNKKISLQYICNQSGISSKGYLSDIMSGKRKLPIDYARPLAQVLGLKGSQKRLFYLYARLHQAMTLEQEKQIQKKIDQARKSLSVQSAPLPGGSYNPLIFSKVFCSFGIKNGSTPYEICDITQENLDEVIKALEELLKQNWVTKTNNKYFINDISQVRFNEGDHKSFHKDLIRNALINAEKKIDIYFDKSKQSFFESSVISVKKSEYEKVLQRIKEVIEDFESELESDEANQLIHFNLQIFPD